MMRLNPILCRSLAALAFTFGSLPLLAQETPPFLSIPVRRVVLYTSGVGYFEHQGPVIGHGQVALNFKTAQINDVLKSLLLEDLDGGQIGAVSYPSQAPLARTLKSFQLDLSANPSLFDLLGQLRGATLRLTLADELIDGTLLGVEKRLEASPAAPGLPPVQVEKAWLTLISGGVLRCLPLELVRKWELSDATLRRELQEALVVLNQSRDQDKKTLVMDLDGKGSRRIRIGYLVEAPVWKATYRLVLGKEKIGQLQGWALVENPTDRDWKQVELSLVGGRPLSFSMNLYQPLYVPRPEAKLEMYSSLQPRVYDQGMADPAMAGNVLAEQNEPVAAAAPAASMAPMMMKSRALGARDSAGARPQEFPMRNESAAAQQVGEWFHYQVPAVSLPRQRSAMIPIIGEAIPLERVSLYNPQVQPTRPLLGVRLQNKTPFYLLQGPVTVLEEGGYSGDAQINDVPPGQERLLSYGIDQGVLAEPPQSRQDQTLTMGRIARGVLVLTYKQTASRTYKFQSQTDAPRTLLIEHARMAGYQLKTPAQVRETTPTHYRLELPLGAKKSAELTVLEEQTQTQQVMMLSSDMGQLEFFYRAKEISPKVREALGKAMEFKRQLQSSRELLAQKDQGRQQIFNDQQRIRQDMQAVQQNSAYYGRLQAKLNDQETLLEKLEKEAEALREQMRRQQSELEAYLQTLEI